MARAAWSSPELHTSTPREASRRARFSSPTPDLYALRASPAEEPESPPWPVAMARGPHPFPSRTRSLSLAARMVLLGRPSGRVRRRRPLYRTAPDAQHERTGAVLHPGGPLRRRGPGDPATPGGALLAPEPGTRRPASLRPLPTDPSQHESSPHEPSPHTNPRRTNPRRTNPRHAERSRADKTYRGIRGRRGKRPSRDEGRDGPGFRWRGGCRASDVERPHRRLGPLPRVPRLPRW